MEEYITMVTEQIRCKKARDMIHDEIKAHIEDQAFAYEEQGMEKCEAVERAVKDMGNPVEVGISLDRIHRPQMAWGMVVLMAVITIVSILVHIVIGLNDPEAGADHVIKQIVYTLAGLPLMFLICLIDYSVIARYVRIIMPVFLVLLISAYFFALQINGSARWIRVGGITTISVIPFMYLFVPLYGALLYQYYGEKWRGIIKSLAWIFLAGIPAYLYSDLSAQISLFGMMIMLFSLAVWKGWFQIKNRKGFLIILWTVMIVGIPLCILILSGTGRLATYQSQRIMGFFGAWKGEGKTTENYVFFQIRNMICNSKFWGESSLENMDSYIAVNMDYVITFLAVHFGYAAVILMAALFGILIGRIFYIALKQKNELGMMMSCGSGMVFLVLSVLYFMSNVSLLPVMSSELPFFSAGVSNMIVSFILMGIVLSVYRFKSILPKNLRITQKEKEGPGLKISAFREEK